MIPSPPERYNWPSDTFKQGAAHLRVGPKEATYSTSKANKRCNCRSHASKQSAAHPGVGSKETNNSHRRRYGSFDFGPQRHVSCSGSCSRRIQNNPLGVARDVRPLVRMPCRQRHQRSSKQKTKEPFRPSLSPVPERTPLSVENCEAAQQICCRRAPEAKTDQSGKEKSPNKKENAARTMGPRQAAGSGGRRSTSATLDAEEMIPNQENSWLNAIILALSSYLGKEA